MGRASRDKGKRGELAAREPLAALTGCDGWERGARQSRRGGGKGCPDLVCDARPGLHPEVKVGRAPRLWAALEQAIEDAAPGCVPFVIAKQDRGRWVLLVEVDRLEELVERLRGGR